MTTTTTLTSFPYYRLTIQKFSHKLPLKHMVNASLFTAELWMHLGDVLGGLLSSQQLEE